MDELQEENGEHNIWLFTADLQPSRKTSVGWKCKILCQQKKKKKIIKKDLTKYDGKEKWIQFFIT